MKKDVPWIAPFPLISEPLCFKISETDGKEILSYLNIDEEFYDSDPETFTIEKIEQFKKEPERRKANWVLATVNRVVADYYWIKNRLDEKPRPSHQARFLKSIIGTCKRVTSLLDEIDDKTLFELRDSGFFSCCYSLVAPRYFQMEKRPLDFGRIPLQFWRSTLTNIVSRQASIAGNLLKKYSFSDSRRSKTNKALRHTIFSLWILFDEEYCSLTGADGFPLAKRKLRCGFIKLVLQAGNIPCGKIGTKSILRHYKQACELPREPTIYI